LYWHKIAKNVRDISLLEKFLVTLQKLLHHEKRQAMRKIVILLCILAIGAYAYYKISGHFVHGTENVMPEWLETDSAAAIERRIAADFSMSQKEVLAAIRGRHPEVDPAMLDSFVEKKYVECMEINGEKRYFRKTVRNLDLLNPVYNGGTAPRGASASEARMSYVDSVLDYYAGRNDKGLAHEVVYRFSIDVPGDEAIEGDTLRVWMPVPMETARQHGFSLLSAEPSGYILSEGRTPHNSIYFESIATAPGDTAHFEYSARFVTQGSYCSAADIERNLQPYDKENAEYKQYTVFDNPHIVRLDSLAAAIVGDETSPFRMSELVYDYIIDRYPWAGAREYSTITCMPEYVLEQGHGDCGQVSLLYISLMRTLGIPARWESGWMLHPGELNLHDWAEVYFEGVGWLPVDVSFGRYTGSKNRETQTFYSHGMDSHRFAANRGVGGEFYPPKRFVRSETVDFQVGEVESNKGNLYYPAWKYKMEIMDIKPVKIDR